MNKILSTLTVTTLLLLPSLARGHGGGLDRHGCHTNRKTGEYHCHRAPATSSPRSTVPRTAPQSTSKPHELFSGQSHEPRTPCSSSGDLVLSAQLLLRLLGYDPGLADGMSGAATDRAVRQFQYRAGITVDGEIDSALIVQMSRSLARKYPRPPGGNQP